MDVKRALSRGQKVAETGEAQSSKSHMSTTEPQICPRLTFAVDALEVVLHVLGHLRNKQRGEEGQCGGGEGVGGITRN